MKASSICAVAGKMVPSTTALLACTAAALLFSRLAAAQHDWENTDALTKHPVFAIMGADAAATAGVARRIGATRKFPGNPLWNQDRDWEPRLDNGYPNVIHDESDPLGAWRMWYGASLWEYATSADGIAWEKPDLGQFDLGHFNRDWARFGTHNNVIMFGNGMGIYKDRHEIDPRARFKAFGGPSCFFGRGGGANNCTGNVQGVAVSPDGLFWYDPKNLSWPYTPGCPNDSCPHQKYDTHQNLFWDARKNKYLAVTRDLKPFPWRSIAIAESLDGEFAWDTTDAPPSVLQGTANEQPYSQITFPYYGIYLGLVSVFDAEFAQTQGKVHVRLSWSLDAETWSWVDEGGLAGKDFIALGGANDKDAAKGGGDNPFDSHVIFAAAYPVKMPEDGSVRVYYMGGNGPHSGPRNSSFALATMRPDGFVSMTGSGTIRTVAIKCTGPTLIVTADVLENGGSVRVGLTGTSSKGLKPSDAVPVTDSATDHAVAFAAGKTLAGLVGQNVVLELVLDRAAVFTVGFKK